MQWIEALGVLTCPCNPCTTYVPPGTLVDQLVDVDVLREAFGVQGSIGREGDPTLFFFYLPALIKATLGDAPPKSLVPDLVVAVQVVDIEPTDIGLDLKGTVIAPVLLRVTNGMAVSAWEPPIVVQTI
jgi:hypothetical protein